MRILTIRQPWASLIVSGVKDIENRSWTTAYRGPVVILAGKGWDKEGAIFAHEHGIALPASLPRGGIIGIVDLQDIVSWHASPWFEGPYGWVLAHPRPLAFHAHQGALGLVKASPALLAALG